METEACTLAAGAEPRALDICLSSGTGEGPTPLAAFDAALPDAGVANYNLLCLSSVIPRTRAFIGRGTVPGRSTTGAACTW